MKLRFTKERNDGANVLTCICDELSIATAVSLEGITEKQAKERLTYVMDAVIKYFNKTGKKIYKVIKKKKSETYAEYAKRYSKELHKFD